MKKKLYLQPVIDVMGIQPLQMLNATRGWSKDGNPPTKVEKEPEVGETGTPGLWDDDGFLDLD
jgi:hypothetical protein